MNVLILFFQPGQSLKPSILGDLLYKISGVSGKMTTETAGDDDNFGTEQSQKAIQRRLGENRCHRVLAGLYMGRSDVALMVRQVRRTLAALEFPFDLTIETIYFQYNEAGIIGGRLIFSGTKFQGCSELSYKRETVNFC